MRTGDFSGFVWNLGYPMNFKFLQCNTSQHKWNWFLHRGAVVPQNLEPAGYNSALGPKSDTC